MVRALDDRRGDIARRAANGSKADVMNDQRPEHVGSAALCWMCLQWAVGACR